MILYNISNRCRNTDGGEDLIHSILYKLVYVQWIHLMVDLYIRCSNVFDNGSLRFEQFYMCKQEVNWNIE